MANPEECDLGGWYFKTQDKNGYDATYDPSFDPDPKTNNNLLLGCDSNCKVVSSFRCPYAADVAAGNPAWNNTACTDRCGDGIYDGPYTEISRTSHDTP